MEKIGLIAGNGIFPLEFARAAREQGLSVVAVAHEGETREDLAPLVDAIFWVKVGQLGKIIAIFKEQGIKDVLMAGGIRKTRLFGGAAPDLRGIAFLAKMLYRKDDAMLRGVAEELESEGITVRESTLYLPNLLAPAGVLTRRKPSREEQRDIEFGWQMAKEIGRLDIGQTIVVKDQAVLAVEAIEGTDEAIRRGARFCKEGAVVVKICKPTQDFRFDLPAVGAETIRIMREVKASCLAVEAGKTVLFERDQVVRDADRAGISLVAMDDQERRSLQE
ncbi:MAG TPA: UDP-2,3-diacylglucosamine diphosphatase LpxI [Nitrospirota bacterium]|nr:UDP-2,3-diacylglucosamine diphosphatase LpxI [Nitrospirota bacterium]